MSEVDGGCFPRDSLYAKESVQMDCLHSEMSLASSRRGALRKNDVTVSGEELSATGDLGDDWRGGAGALVAASSPEQRL